MSGIKDYEYSYTIERRRRLREAAIQLQQQRAAATEAELGRKRRKARETIESMQAARAEATREVLARQARETQQTINAIRDASQDEHNSLPAKERPESTLTQSDVKDNAEKVAELTEQLAEIEAWRETLAGDNMVHAFQAQEWQVWQGQVKSLVDDHAAGRPTQDILVRAQEIHREAQHIHDEAGERQSKFEARNQLLRDIITSLKEIGFFVSDPSYQNADDPTGPIVLRASRGSEEMTATVDLSETVKSVWNGLEEEHCKSAFCQYVEQMKERGIEITAHRPELRARPILRQKGVLDLPQRGTETIGG